MNIRIISFYSFLKYKSSISNSERLSYKTRISRIVMWFFCRSRFLSHIKSVLTAVACSIKFHGRSGHKAFHHQPVLPDGICVYQSLSKYIFLNVNRSLQARPQDTLFSKKKQAFYIFKNVIFFNYNFLKYTPILEI